MPDLMWLEAIALLIVVSFVILRARFGPRPRAFLRRLALLVVASWLAENSVIMAYGFYSYSPEWSVFIHHVPLAIVLIWPIVIHSAWELSSYLLGDARRLTPLVGALLVLADASMIEPIAVSAKLWRWHQPGLFEVPPIGILGWAFYAGLCMLVFQRNDEAKRSARADLSCLLLAPLGSHVLLLAAWWLLFRWINQPVAPWPVVALAWLLALCLALWSLKRQARNRVPRLDMLLRVPAALYFFVLLALASREKMALVAYACAFAPPYLSLTRLSAGPADDPVATDE